MREIFQNSSCIENFQTTAFFVCAVWLQKFYLSIYYEAAVEFFSNTQMECFYFESMFLKIWKFQSIELLLLIVFSTPSKVSSDLWLQSK